MINNSRVAEDDVERGRRVNIEHNNFMAVVVENSGTSSDNMELIERALFGPDDADDIFSSARSALALSAAAASIVSSNNSRSSWWRQNRRRNIEGMEASVRAAHQILDRLETEHRRRKKEKYIKLVRALECTSMVVQECQLIHDDDIDDNMPREDDNCITHSEDIVALDQEDGNDNDGQLYDGDGRGPGLESDREKSTTSGVPAPTTPASLSSLLITNDSNNTHRVIAEHASVDDRDENNHTVLCIPLGARFPQHATISTPSTITPPTNVTKSNIHRNVSSTCAICLVNYQPGNYVSWSSNEECRHVFHRDCILLWLLKKNGTGGGIVGNGNHNERRHLCPCCRREFVPDWDVNPAP
jgi:hypothetical protein